MRTPAFPPTPTTKPQWKRGSRSVGRDGARDARGGWPPPGRVPTPQEGNGVRRAPRLPRASQNVRGLGNQPPGVSALRVEQRDHPDFVRVLMAVPLAALQLVVGDGPSWRVLLAAGRTGRRLSREDGPLGFGQVDEYARRRYAGASFVVCRRDSLIPSEGSATRNRGLAGSACPIADCLPPGRERLRLP